MLGLSDSISRKKIIADILFSVPPPPARGMKGSIRMSGGGSVLVQQLDTSLSVVEQRLSAASICFG